MQRIEEAAAEPLGKVLVRCGMGEVKSSDAQRTEDAEDDNTPPTVTASAQASSIVWHAGNVFLLVFTFISLWWNMWLSPHGGRCGVEEEALSNSPPSTRLGAAAEGIMPLRTPGAGNETSGRGLWFDFWFFPSESSGLQDFPSSCSLRARSL